MPRILAHPTRPEIVPRIAPTAFVAPGATVIGEVDLAEEASVWFGAVLRGDVGSIRIGARSNIQDLACVHMTGGHSVTAIGDNVTVGHGAILHGCTIGDRCLIGMGSTILDLAVVGEESVIAAGTLVPPRMQIPPRSLVRGNPARVVREVTEAEARLGIDGADHYVVSAREYRAALSRAP